MSSVNLKRQKEVNAQMSEVMDDFDRFEYFFAGHWKQIVWAAVAVVIIVAVIVSIKVYANSQQMAAASAFSQAQTIEQLEAALDKYASADAAPSAEIRLASLYMAKKDFAKAKALLTDAAGNSSEPEIASRARLNLGYLAELEGKLEDAANIFAAFAANDNGAGYEGYRAEAYIAAGRLYIQAKKFTEAKALLSAGREFVKSANAANGNLMMFEPQITCLLAAAEKAPAAKTK